MEVLEFKKSYPFIFSFFYLIQGFYNGIQYIVIPFWVLSIMSVDLAAVLGIFAITTIPWFLKFIIGLLNDRFGTKKFGRRKPWILFAGIYAGIWFIITGILLPSQELANIFSFFTICALMWNIGIAFADTSLDGMILDVTPKEKLGKVQAYTWSMNTFGNAAGGVILGAIFLSLNAIELLFVLEGILLFISCSIPMLVQENPIPEEIPIWNNLKLIFKKRENWKVFISSMVDSVPNGVVSLAYSLLILLYAPVALISGPVNSLSLKGAPVEAFIVYCIFGLIFGIGVVVGGIILGRIADKKRKLSVYIANAIYIPLIIISFLFRGPYILGGIMIALLGFGDGALKASFQSVRGDISNKYPELRSTYFALIISFLNGGQTLGLALTSILLPIFSGIFSEYYMVFFCITIIMAIFQILCVLIFMTIDTSLYEFEENL